MIAESTMVYFKHIILKNTKGEMFYYNKNSFIFFSDIDFTVDDIVWVLFVTHEIWAPDKTQAHHTDDKGIIKKLIKLKQTPNNLISVFYHHKTFELFHICWNGDSHTGLSGGELATISDRYVLAQSKYSKAEILNNLDDTSNIISKKRKM